MLVHHKFLTVKLYRSNVTHRETYKKQSGGRGKFADIQFEIAPISYFNNYEGKQDRISRDEGFMFINEIVGGNIPREFIPAVEKGFKAGIRKWYSG